MNNEEKIIEQIEEKVPSIEDLNEEDILQFYEENKDAIDLMGGLDMFESLMGLDDEQFTILKDQFLQLFNETLNEEESIRELRALIFTQNYTIDKIENDFNTVPVDPTFSPATQPDICSVNV